ncbi:hypothetical protein ETB97_003513 [Aspergillus alliaceus]|uniref:Uncharacterized protein n=1 Tax=Petromyces alliaceus TaxID=209559 RepID=A0A8H6A1M4_PETAA|nr:hypothetical protein ETB97_003513 [Aspergillus burnettii]
MAVINQKATPPVSPSHHAPVQQLVDPALYYQRLPPGLYHPSAYPAAYQLAHHAAHPAAYPASHPVPQQVPHPAVQPANHPGNRPADHPGGLPGGLPGGHQIGHQGGQPEGYPGAPRAIHTVTPRSIDPAKLAEAMARLNASAERPAPGNRQRAPDSVPPRETDSRFYIGYTFFKKDAIPGHKPTWSHAEKTQINLTQSELSNMVQKRAKKLPGIQQYQSLSKVKRTHVDLLIHELKENEPNFEWTCACVKEAERPMKGKNNKRGDYETISMDVVAMGQPIYPPRPKASNKPKEKVEPKTDNPIIVKESRPVEKAIENTTEWTRPYPGHVQQPQQPPMVHNVQRQLNPEFTQQAPPPPPPPQVHPTGGRPLVNQAPLPKAAPATVSFDVRPQLDIPHAARAAPEKRPAIEVLKEHMRSVPVGAGAGQGVKHAPSPAGMPVINNIPQKEPAPHDPRFHEHVPHGGSVKPPNLAAEPEQEWAPDSSSIGDDDSEIFDLEDVSSVTDDSDDDGEARKESQPWRGSLFRRHSSASRRPGPSRYRSHYRKQPTGASDSRYPNGYIDVIPADNKDSDKQLWRLHSREVTRQTRDRPKIIHAPISSDDLDVPEFEDRYRGLRAHNDIRSRILDDREARLARREQHLDYRTRMLDALDERLDEALRRRMSLREPGSYYSRQYYDNY